MSISNFASKFDDDIFDVVIPGESVYFDYKCNYDYNFNHNYNCNYNYDCNKHYNYNYKCIRAV